MNETDSHQSESQESARQTLPPLPSATDPRRKSPVLAGLLSLMPGLGQVYTGYYQRGFVHVIIVAIVIALLASGDLGPLIPLAGIFLAFFWLYNVIDACRRAALINEALAGRTSFELPDDLAVPGFVGSVPGGLAIAAIGFVLLMNTLLDVSLDWIEEWWPVALIAFGGYLVYKAKRDQPAPVRESDDF